MRLKRGGQIPWDLLTRDLLSQRGCSVLETNMLGAHADRRARTWRVGWGGGQISLRESFVFITKLELRNKLANSYI